MKWWEKGSKKRNIILEYVADLPEYENGNSVEAAA